MGGCILGLLCLLQVGDVVIEFEARIIIFIAVFKAGLLAITIIIVIWEVWAIIDVMVLILGFKANLVIIVIIANIVVRVLGVGEGVVNFI